MLKTYHARDNNTGGLGMRNAYGDNSMTDRIAGDRILAEEDVLSDDIATRHIRNGGCRQPGDAC